MVQSAGRNPLWYVKRGKKIRGPFPPARISHEILLGRIRSDDELSHDQQSWHRLAELPQLLPEVIRHGDTPEGQQRLVLTRLREDQRLHDRRAGGESAGSGKRHGDRRNIESFEITGVRDLPERRPVEAPTTETSLLVPALVLTAIFSLALYFFWYRPAVVPAGPDCNAPPAPAVNWSGCGMAGRSLGRADLREANLGSIVLTRADLHNANLTRSDLRYADLEGANLYVASLREANLTGALLRNAILTRADLRDADLSYATLQDASLEGARLEGAKLGKTIWTDGRMCAPESIGECR